MKAKRAKPADSKATRNKAHAPPTSQLNRQTRKVLGQHYRAKYGINGKI